MTDALTRFSTRTLATEYHCSHVKFVLIRESAFTFTSEANMRLLANLNRGFRSMIDDGTGAISSTRVTMLSTVGIILAKAVMFNVMALIQSKGSVGFDSNDVVILGIAFGGKVLNTLAERLAQGKVG
jgi:hypothetical protein